MDNNRRGNGISSHSYGYVLLKIPNHPRANKMGFVYEHTHKMEEKLGRPLKENEVVHHVNGNPKDNNPENLVVFINQSEHRKHHAQERLIKAGINPDTEKWCNKCKRILPKGDFSPSSSRGKPTLSSRCRSCCKEDQQIIRDKKKADNKRILQWA